MPNWKIQSVQLRLEYAVRTDDPDDRSPYEIVRDFPVEFDPTDPMQIPGKVAQAILGLTVINNGGQHYRLYRLQNDKTVTFDFDNPAKRLIRVSGALKVLYKLKAQVVLSKSGTIIYPFQNTEDEIRPNFDPALAWKYLLTREAGDSGGYHLIYSRLGGGGVGEGCENMPECKNPPDDKTLNKCFAKGCY